MQDKLRYNYMSYERRKICNSEGVKKVYSWEIKNLNYVGEFHS